MNHLGFRPAADISDLPQWQQNILNPSGRSLPAYYEDGNKSYGDSYVVTPYHADPPPQVNINQNVQNNTTVIVGQPEPYYYPVYRDDWSTRQHFYLHNRNTKRLRRARTLDEKVIEAIKSKLEEPKSIIWRLRSIP